MRDIELGLRMFSKGAMIVSLRRVGGLSKCLWTRNGTKAHTVSAGDPRHS